MGKNEEGDLEQKSVNTGFAAKTCLEQQQKTGKDRKSIYSFNEPVKKIQFKLNHIMNANDTDFLQGRISICIFFLWGF